MRFLRHVCGRRFSVEARRDASIGQASQLNVQKGEFAINLRFSGELDSRVYVIEGLVEVRGGVGGGRSRSQTRAAREVSLSDRTKDIIHVYANVFWLLDATLISERKGFIHGVEHPKFRDCYHDRESYRPRVLLRVVAAVEGEIC